MSLRAPQNPNGNFDFETGRSTLEAELLAERAASFGRLGRSLREALDRLAADPSDAALDKASNAAWSFLVQREACGLYDHRETIADYAIPGPVLARMGAVKR